MISFLSGLVRSLSRFSLTMRMLGGNVRTKTGKAMFVSLMSTDWSYCKIYRLVRGFSETDRWVRLGGSYSGCTVRLLKVRQRVVS